MNNLSHLPLVFSLTLLSCVIGAWELAVTRLSSVLYYFDITYLALAVCLLGLSIGALGTKAYGQKLNLLPVMLALLISMPPAWWFITHYDAAWALGVFAWPFVLFGAATTLAWHRMANSAERTHLYVGELSGAVVGLVLVGPLLLSLMPINVLGTIGVQTHLKNTVEREGLVDHHYATSAYARTDVVRTERESVVYFFTDAMFVTRAVAWDGTSSHFSDPHIEDLARLKRLALQSAKRDNVLLLGSGAGFDTAVALQQGAAHIDAVEVNPKTIQIARTLDSWAGGVFSSPKVSTHVAEARRFIATANDRWDQINLNLLQTSPAAGRGRSHVDARVLTVEAIQDYHGHLRPLGALTVIQNSPELASRAYAAILAANGNREDRILSFQLSEPTNPFSYLLIARNEAFTNVEVEKLQSIAKDFDAVIATYPSLANPATDDKPFIFEPADRIAIHALLAATLTLLILMIVLGRERHTPGNPLRGSAAALIGIASMALQVLVIYRLQTAIGSPALSLGIGLAAVLGGSGLGALLFHRFATTTFWRQCGMSAAVGVAVFSLFSTPLANYCATLSHSYAIITMATFTVITCLPVGLPFLAAIDSCKALSGHGEGLVIGCDGLGSIVGATGATALAMVVGFNATGALVVVCFACFAALAPQQNSRIVSD